MTASIEGIEIFSNILPVSSIISFLYILKRSHAPMKLYHKTYGQGDPVVILHGLFGMLDNWKSFAKDLGKDYTVILPDQRNHGRSPHAEEISYPLLASDLKEFLSEQWIFDAHIMGHSMGGKTAMQFALDYPDMTRSVISVDMGPGKYDRKHDFVFEALNAVPIEEIEERSQAREILEQHLEDKSVVLFLLKNLKRKKSGGYEWKMNLPVLYREYEKILAAIESEHAYDGPALFVHGERSQYVEEENTDEIERLFPKARIHTIKNAGHWVHAEQPDALLNTVHRFLKEAES